MTIVLVAALIWQVIDFLREVANLRVQKSAVLTQLTAWGGGFVVIVLAAHASVTAALIFPGTDAPLHTLNFASQLLLGLMAASTASSAVDVKQALDGRDSSAKPPLLVDHAPPAVGPAAPVAP